jgi:hypothetical protein
MALMTGGRDTDASGYHRDTLSCHTEDRHNMGYKISFTYVSSPHDIVDRGAMTCDASWHIPLALIHGSVNGHVITHDAHIMNDADGEIVREQVTVFVTIVVHSRRSCIALIFLCWNMYWC